LCNINQTSRAIETKRIFSHFAFRIEALAPSFASSRRPDDDLAMPAPSTPSLAERIAGLTVNAKTGEHSKIHIFALALAALHVLALVTWVALTVRQRPVSVRDRVDPDKEE